MESTRQAILLLFCTSLDVALLSSALCQCILHQACMHAPLLEVQLSIDHCSYLPGLVGAQCLSQDHMGKEEGSLGIPLLVKHPLPLRSQDFSKQAPHLSWGVEYQLADCTASDLQQLFHLASSGTPPARCIP